MIKKIVLNEDQRHELEKIGSGAFAPLQGFMNKADFMSVVKTMRLSNGELFPIPIVLDLCYDEANQLASTSEVQLIFNNELVGWLSPESIYTIDKQDAARSIFGFDELAHPGVARFMQRGEVFIGGPVTLKKPAKYLFPHMEFAPAQTKIMFQELGWKTVAAFHTRNVPHRAHEWLHRMALNLCDGLFIHPIIGGKKGGDFSPKAVIACYEKLMSEFLPKKRTRLGTLTISASYAGPREAVFHALVRRNFGCTHIVIGRDHAGVGTYYDTYASQSLCKRLEDELGIIILNFETPHYCKKCDGVVNERTCPHMDTDPTAITSICGSDIRKRIKSGQKIEKHLIRPEIIECLVDLPVFTV